MSKSIHPSIGHYLEAVLPSIQTLETHRYSIGVGKALNLNIEP